MATLGTQNAGVTYVQTTDAAAQAVRYWLPTSKLPTTLLIWSHPHAQNEQITPSYFAYSIVHAAIQEGWAVIAHNEHANSWGDNASLTDLLAAYTFMATFGTITNVILCGASMGGLPTALAIAGATLPAGKVKGAFVIDAVLSLADIYTQAAYTSSIDTAYSITRGTLSGNTSVNATSLPTTSSFPNIGTQLLVGNGTANHEIVTTTGASSGTAVAVTAFTKTHSSADQVSDFPTKTSGHDPLLISGATYGTPRWRFYASTADVTVDKTLHTDPFKALVAPTAGESAIVTHASTHLTVYGSQPRDVVAFIKRCIA